MRDGEPGTFASPRLRERDLSSDAEVGAGLASRPGRSQAERSDSMRARLIEAAIACLHRSGYSATSVAAVTAEAGTSRGAMTHHFPAKTDLMLAVAATCSQRTS